VQSLKEDFTFAPLVPLIVFSPNPILNTAHHTSNICLIGFPFCSMEYDEETPLGSCLAPLVFGGETLFD
jgi:hypothetical protein